MRRNLAMIGVGRRRRCQKCLGALPAAACRFDPDLGFVCDDFPGCSLTEDKRPMIYIQSKETGVTVEDNQAPDHPVRCTTDSGGDDEDSHCYSVAEADALLRGLLRWKLEMEGELETQLMFDRVVTQFNRANDSARVEADLRTGKLHKCPKCEAVFETEYMFMHRCYEKAIEQRAKERSR